MSATKTPGADAIGAMVRERALDLYPQLRDAVGVVAKAVIALREAQDMPAIVRCANTLSLAAEVVEDAAQAVHTHADAALLHALLESGAPALHCGHHTLGTRQNPERVEILDRQSVPEAFLVPADPKLDLPAIRQHLKNHSEVNWATLTPGSVSLTRKAVK